MVIFAVFTVIWLGLTSLLLRRCLSHLDQSGYYRWRVVVATYLIAGVAVAISAIVLVGHPQGWLINAQIAASWVSDLAGLAAAAGAARLLLRRIGGSGPDGARRLARLLFKHRLSLIPVVVIIAVAVLPAAEIMDQVPDIVRSWLDRPAQLAPQWAAATVLTVAWSIGLLLAGRARTQLFARNWDHKPVGAGTPPSLASMAKARLSLWFLAAAALLVAGLVVAAWGGQVTWGRLLVAMLVPAAAGTASAVIRWRRAKRGKGPAGPPPRTYSSRDLSHLQAVGDLLAVALLCVASLALSRATTAVVALQLLEVIHPGPAPAIGLIVGLAGAYAVWPVAGRALSAIAATTRDTAANPAHPTADDKGPVDPDTLDPTDDQQPQLDTPPLSTTADKTPLRQRLQRWLAAAITPICGAEDAPLVRRLGPSMIGAGLLLYVAIAVAPDTAIDAGPLAVLEICLMSMTALLVGVGLVVQRRRPAELFTALHLRSTPVFALFVIMVLFAGQISARTPIHPVRENPDGPNTPTVNNLHTDPRPSLDDTLRGWIKQQPSTCGHQATAGGETLNLVPMLLVAAQGGGIRAAYWTGSAMDKIAAIPQCGSHATALSSGVSGGAVGLAAARFNTDVPTALDNLSSGDALAVGLDGLFTRDFVHAATGIPLPWWQPGVGWHPGWTDRAALMEDAWAAAGSWRGRTLASTESATDDPARTGRLILNSMSVASACRVWVTEIKLSDATQPPDDIDKLSCSTVSSTNVAGAPAARSIDLISEFGGFGAPNRPALRGCVRDLQVPTAAMLAARFPYITPSGQVGPCTADITGRPASAGIDQLVDGGYLENTGLGTINDLAPRWLSTVQQWNAAQQAGTKTRPRTIIVPMIVYLANGSGNDRTAPRRDLTNEALVPPLAALRASSSSVTDDANLQRSTELTTPATSCGATDTACQTAVPATFARRVFVIYPATTPQLAAPLGWTLSWSTRDAMDTALDRQSSRPCITAEPQTTAACSRGYGSLADLITAVSP